jgi:hypothetical protein
VQVRHHLGDEEVPVLEPALVLGLCRRVLETLRNVRGFDLASGHPLPPGYNLPIPDSSVRVNELASMLGSADANVHVLLRLESLLQDRRLLLPRKPRELGFHTASAGKKKMKKKN